MPIDIEYWKKNIQEFIDEIEALRAKVAELLEEVRALKADIADIETRKPSGTGKYHIGTRIRLTRAVFIGCDDTNMSQYEPKGKEGVITDWGILTERTSSGDTWTYRITLDNGEEIQVDDYEFEVLPPLPPQPPPAPNPPWPWMYTEAKW